MKKEFLTHQNKCQKNLNHLYLQVFSVPWEFFLIKKIQDQKNKSQIIFEKKTTNVGSYTFFTRDVDQYKNRSLSQLYQPPRTVFSQNIYHWLLSSCEYCKVFKNRLFYRTPPEAVVCRYSSKQVFLKVSQTSKQSTCVGVSS